VLNLAEMPDMDSAGLGELVRTYTKVNQANGSLKLMNVTKRIRDLLVVTKLVTVFETFDSDAEALQSFLVV
jgi:anti-sigma B factor antagonist